MTELQLSLDPARKNVNEVLAQKEAQLVPMIQWNIEHKRKFFEGLLLATIGAIAGLLAAKETSDLIQNYCLYSFALFFYFLYPIYYASYFVVLLTREGKYLDALLTFYRTSQEKTILALEKGPDAAIEQWNNNVEREEKLHQQWKNKFLDSDRRSYQLAGLFVAGSVCAALAFFYLDIIRIAQSVLAIFCFKH